MCRDGSLRLNGKWAPPGVPQILVRIVDETEFYPVCTKIIAIKNELYNPR